MKTNTGLTDKRIRLSVGGVLFLASMFLTSFLAAIAGVYGLLTGLLGWCPIYHLFGLDTCTLKKEEPVVPPSENEEGGTKPKENG